MASNSSHGSGDQDAGPVRSPVQETEIAIGASDAPADQYTTIPPSPTDADKRDRGSVGDKVEPAPAFQRAGRSSPRSDAALPPLQQVGNYRLLRSIGSGAMGDVYLAEHLQFSQRRYAVKLIRRERVSDRARSRFEREITALSSLSHPNLVFASDAGVDDGQMYLVMEYVDGADLQKTIRCHGTVQVSAAAEILRQAALGLHHAHEHDVVHRDVKPANLIVTTDGDVKLLDLGVASLQGDASRVTRDGDVMGTAAFLAPELWHSAHLASPQSDLYALACTAYSLLTGHPPFGSSAEGSLTELLLQHQNETPTPLDQIRSDVPEDLAELIQRNLAKSSTDRSGSAIEFAKEIEPFCRPISGVLLSPAQPAGTESSGAEAPTAGHDATTSPSGSDPNPPSSYGQKRQEVLRTDPSEREQWTRNAEQPEPILWRVVAVVGLLSAIATISLVLAYFGPLTTETWQLRFDKLGDPSNPRGVGFSIELIRVWLYVTATTTVIGLQFTREVRTFFNPRIWTRSVIMLRLTILAVIGVFVVAEGTRQLTVSQGPTQLAQWGIEHGIETTPANEARPYQPYLLYSLVNYTTVMGGLFAFPMIRFWFSDLRYITVQLRQFKRRQSVQVNGERLTANLHRFGSELRGLTSRYISVLGVLAIGAHYDYWIGSMTLTDAGQNTMLMGMVVAYLALIFVLVIAYLFFRGFDCTSRRIATVGGIDDERLLSQVTLVWFLKTTLLYNLGGLACISLLVLFADAMFF